MCSGSVVEFPPLSIEKDKDILVHGEIDVYLKLLSFPLSIHHLGKYQNSITCHSNKEMFQDTLQIQIQIQIQILLRFWASSWDIPLVYECTT